MSLVTMANLKVNITTADAAGVCQVTASALRTRGKTVTPITIRPYLCNGGLAFA